MLLQSSREMPPKQPRAPIMTAITFDRFDSFERSNIEPETLQPDLNQRQRGLFRVSGKWGTVPVKGWPNSNLTRLASDCLTFSQERSRRGCACEHLPTCTYICACTYIYVFLRVFRDLLPEEQSRARVRRMRERGWKMRLTISLEIFHCKATCPLEQVHPNLEILLKYKSSIFEKSFFSIAFLFGLTTYHFAASSSRENISHATRKHWAMGQQRALK